MSRSRSRAALCVALLGLLSAVFVWSRKRTGESLEQAAAAASPRSRSEDSTNRRFLEPLGTGARQPLAPDGSSSAAARAGQPVEDASDRLLLRVKTSTGAAVETAEVFQRAARGVERLGAVDEAGELEVQAVRGARVVLVATAPGWASASVLVPDPRPDALTISLSEGATIAGRIERFDGSTAGEGIHVVALPAHLSLSLNGLKPERLLGDPEVRLTQSDASGAFELRDLDPKLRYSVIAGGNGLVQESPRHFVAPGSSDLELVVLRAHALFLRLVEPTGDPVEFPAEYVGPGGVKVTLADRSARFASGYAPSHWMCGIPPELEDPPDHARLFVFVSLTNAPVVGPVELSASPPGYQRGNLSVLVPPLEHGVFEQAWIMTPTGTGFGSLNVSFLGLPVRADPANRFGSRGFVKLAVDERRFLKYAVPASSGLSHRIDHVPHGRYRVSFESVPDHAIVPEAGGEGRLVEIGEVPTAVEFDFSRQGALELLVTAPNGRPYLGELTVTLNIGALKEEPDRSIVWAGGRAAFFRPPYVLYGLQPGAFAVRAEDPLPTEQSWSSFVVESGALTQVGLQLR